jgi:hypothetical protein
MSLSSHLNNFDSPVRQFFDTNFPNVRPVQLIARPDISSAKIRTIRPNGEIQYGTVGMALDYRLRYYFQAAHYTSLLAFWGAGSMHPSCIECFRLEIMMSSGEEIDEKSRKGRIFGVDTARLALYGQRSKVSVEFFASLHKLVDRVTPAKRRLEVADERALCRHCIILAYYEQIIRAGIELVSALHQGHTLKKLLALPEENWIDDLCANSWSFYDNFSHLLQYENLTLNPKFDGSMDVGGADGDIIVDGCLIDFKMTVNPSLEKLFLYQLLGYVLLDYSNRHNIDSVGILYARQGLLLRWDLKKLMALMYHSDTPPDLAKLRADFQEMNEKRRQKQEQKRQKFKTTREEHQDAQETTSRPD